MTSLQKIIRYMAMALAIFIIVCIASSLLLSLNIFSDVLGLNKKQRNVTTSEIKSENKITKDFTSGQINNLKIELECANLTIKRGEKISVETDTSRIESKRNSTYLTIKEKDSMMFMKNNPKNVVVTIPDNIILDTIKIEAGVGTVEIDKLSAKNLTLDMGAGKANIKELQITQKAKIEGGAGSIVVGLGEINNLDLDMGIGSFKLTSKLGGDNKINAGVGRLELELIDGFDNYTIRATKGVGDITLGGKTIYDNTEQGNGETKIKINGGIGKIEIK